MSELNGKKYDGKISKLAKKYNDLMLHRDKETIEWEVIPSKTDNELER